MSRSEDPVVVRAELMELDPAQLVELLVPTLGRLRHAVNTAPGWLESVRRQPDLFPLLCAFDGLGLLE